MVHGIKNKLLLWFVIFTIFLGLLTTVIVNNTSNRASIINTERLNKYIISSIGKDVAAILTYTYRVNDQLSGLHTLNNYSIGYTESDIVSFSDFNTFASLFSIDDFNTVLSEIKQKPGFYNVKKYGFDYIGLLRLIDNGKKILITCFRADLLYDLFTNSELSNKGGIYLIDDKSRTLLSTFRSQDLEVINFSYFNLKNKDMMFYKEFKDGENLINYYYLKDFNQILYFRVNRVFTSGGLNQLKSLAFLIEFFRTVILIVIAYILISYFVKPIEILTFYMNKFMANRGRSSIEDKIIKSLNSRINSNTEVGALTKTFCSLLISQRDLNDEIIFREKLKVEEERMSKNYMTSIFNSIPSMIVSIDSSETITHWNTGAEKLTGRLREDVLGSSIWEVFPVLQRFRYDIGKIIDVSMTDQCFDTKNVKWDGKFINIVANELSDKYARGVIIRVDDVTEKVRIGEILIQSEKMLSVGGLAAGMAHEINNPLAGMMQSASVINNRLWECIDIPVSQKAAEEAGTSVEAVKRFISARNIPKMLENIQESGVLIKTIITNMLGFARKGSDITSVYDIGEILEKSLKLASADLRCVTVSKFIEDSVPRVQCDSVKIQQVFLNIIVNAVHAMEGALTENPKLDIFVRMDKEDLNRVVIEFEDNGPGIDFNSRKRIFEPFFTTKPVGLGTGLGLSVSYFIITENHGGELSVDSTPGYGAKFIIKLPIKHLLLESGSAPTL